MTKDINKKLEELNIEHWMKLVLPAGSYVPYVITNNLVFHIRTITFYKWTNNYKRKSWRQCF